MPAKAGAPKPSGKAVEDTADLRAEVKAFASQLGLSAASGGGSAFGYDDFAPSKARQRPSAADAKAPKDNQKQRDGESNGKQKPQNKHHDGKQQQAASGSKQRAQGGKPAAEPPSSRGQQRQQQRQQQQRKGASGSGGDHQNTQHAQQQQQQQNAAVQERTWVDSVGPRPGESKGRSLMSHDEPTIWWEASGQLPKLDGKPPKGGAAAAPLDEAAAEKLRAAGEALMEREAGVFERDLARRNAADSKWLAQVRRSGTTADKVAAMTLLVQVRGPGGSLVGGFDVVL